MFFLLHNLKAESLLCTLYSFPFLGQDYQICKIAGNLYVTGVLECVNSNYDVVIWYVI